MIEQAVPSHTCLACQGCCRFIDRHSEWAPCLLKEEALGAGPFSIPPALIDAKYRLCLEPSPKSGMFICPGLDEEKNSCRLYGVRPFECQLYPFLLKRRQGKVFLALDLNCPFAHEHKDDPAFLEYAGRLAAYLRTPAARKMLEENRHLLHEYEGSLEVAELNV